MILWPAELQAVAVQAVQAAVVVDDLKKPVAQAVHTASVPVPPTVLVAASSVVPAAHENGGTAATAEQMRSLVAVGAASSYCAIVHTVSAVQTRLVVTVGAAD